MAKANKAPRMIFFFLADFWRLSAFPRFSLPFSTSMLAAGGEG